MEKENLKSDRVQDREGRITDREMDRGRHGNKILKVTGYKNHTKEFKNRYTELHRGRHRKKI